MIKRLQLVLAFSLLCSFAFGQKKAIFILLDGIPADVIEKVNTPSLDQIAEAGGYTRSYVGGEKGEESETAYSSASSCLVALVISLANDSGNSLLINNS